jgi:pilus assembly protein CpaB
MVAKWRLRLFWAALLAMVTAWGVTSYLSALRETEPVVVALQEIPARAEITPDMVTVIEINRTDRGRLAKDAFQTLDEVVGRYARKPIEEGAVLRDRPGELTNPGEMAASARVGEGALADIIPRDARAMTLKLDKEAVLGQHIQPGNRVDVIFTSKSDSTGGVYSSLVLQLVQVLEIEYPAEDASHEDALVTLLVTAEQAVDLALAKRTGSVDLALSPPDASGPIPVRTTSPLKFAQQSPIPPGQADISQVANPER